MTRKQHKDFLELQWFTAWVFEYIEFDEIMTNYNGEKTYTFPNVVVSISEKEKKNIERILKL